jgi:cardiolipin synthase
MTTGFFVPPPDLVHALERAAWRGVDVQLVLPSHSDSTLALAAGRAYYEDLMEAGVKIWEREDAVLHAKTTVIDGAWATVGSANLDFRSVLFNNELNAVILGEAFGAKMEEMFRDDTAQSKRIDPLEWSRRPFGEKFGEWRARLLEYFL